MHLEQLSASQSANIPSYNHAGSQESLMINLQTPKPVESLDNQLLTLQQKIQELELTVKSQETLLRAKGEELLKAKEEISRSQAENLRLLRQSIASSNIQAFFQPAETSVIGMSKASCKQVFDVTQNAEHDEVKEQKRLSLAKN